MQLNNINTMNFQIFFQLLSAVGIYALYNCFQNKQLEYHELSGNAFEEQILGMFFFNSRNLRGTNPNLLQTLSQEFHRTFLGSTVEVMSSSMFMQTNDLY